MDTQAILQQVESLYRRILELTLRQEALLAGDDASELPAVVSEKFALLDGAQKLLSAIDPDEDRSSPLFQKGVEALRSVLAEVVASEERCKVFVPPPAAPSPPAPRRVMAAYGRR